MASLDQTKLAFIGFCLPLGPNRSFTSAHPKITMTTRNVQGTELVPCSYDLITPRPQYRFAGLKPDDHWCLCVLRWREALAEGVAPPVYLKSTHSQALEHVSLDQLQAHAAD
jgi:hypothetical protein